MNPNHARMTPHPAAVAALRVAACPWSLQIVGEVPTLPSPGLGNHKGVTTPVGSSEGTEAV